MRRFSGKTLLACLLVAAIQSVSAQQGAGPVPAALVVSSGLEGGGYWNEATRLQAAARGVGLSVENRTSTGSLANLKALTDPGSAVSLAFTQADALHYYLDGNPAARGAVETLQGIGRECVFIISDSDSKIRSDKDMQKMRRMSLGIRSPNSGIRVTYDYMASLVPELQHIAVYYGDAAEMMKEFSNPLGDVKAVMIVQRPDERSPEIDMVLANPDRYRFVKINDERFSRKSASGEAAYQREKVAPGAVAGARAVETICMQGLLVANQNKLSAEQRNQVAQLIKRD